MTVTEFDIRHQARQLADAYATLKELSETPPRPANVHNMKPDHRSQSPISDGDYALNIEIELMRETTDNTIPGGFRTMAVDALTYTTAKAHTPRGDGYLDSPDHGILCAHISFHAHIIAADFPAADDLHELMQAQETYIRRAIGRRWGEPQQVHQQLAAVRPTGYGTAADIAPLVSAVIGRTITRKMVTYWGRSGRITQHLNDDGTSYYSLAEAIDAARSYRDTRRRLPLD